jgi:hypothetical protein
MPNLRANIKCSVNVFAHQIAVFLDVFVRVNRHQLVFIAEETGWIDYWLTDAALSSFLPLRVLLIARLLILPTPLCVQCSIVFWCHECWENAPLFCFGLYVPYASWPLLLFLGARRVPNESLDMQD